MPAATHGNAPQAPYKVLSLLYLVYVTLSADKSVIGVLGEPFRVHFGLSDSQLGLLIGLAYAAPFALASVPLGRLIDRVNRKVLLAHVLAIWSFLTAATAFASTYVVLLVLRGGVGAAESAGPPAMLSIIADTFDVKRRPRAIGIYYTAASAGAMLGMICASRIAAIWGWRVSLVSVALPGFVLAVILVLCMREPQRGRFDNLATSSSTVATGWQSALRFLWSEQRCALTVAAIATSSGIGFSIIYWVTPLLMRSYGLGIGEAGLIGFGFGLGGALGAFVGGWISTHYLADRQDQQLLLCALSILTAISLVFAALFAPSPRVAMIMFTLFALANAIWFGPGFGVCLSCVPATVRGTIAALILLLSNLLGGIGPLLVGILSDLFKKAEVHNPLRLAVAAITIMGFVPIALYVRAARQLRAEKPLFEIPACTRTDKLAKCNGKS
jgi:predicted MFS family arabinose efflux permease